MGAPLPCEKRRARASFELRPAPFYPRRRGRSPTGGVTMRKPGAFDRLRRSAAASVSINATVTITPKNWCTRELVSAGMLGGKLYVTNYNPRVSFASRVCEA